MQQELFTLALTILLTNSSTIFIIALVIRGHVTTTEAGGILGVTDSRIRQLYGDKQLKGQLIGRVLLITLSSIERYQRRKEAAKRAA